MARYYGAIGYSVTTQTSPGIWEQSIVQRNYYGDVTRTSRRLQNGQSINNDITVNNTISIVADAYANQNFFAIRYARWMGTKWSVSTVQVQPPRLILSLGGVYNGPQS